VNGNFGYSKPGSPHSPDTLTGAGILNGQLLGIAKHGFIRAALQQSANCAYTFDMKHPRPLYYLYYMTQAKFQEGGATWEQWNKGVNFAKELVVNQAEDGHWENTDSHGAGLVYSTTLACLSLEVYYRYLPTYKQQDQENWVEGGADAAAAGNDDVAVAVEVLDQ
jgi:hypothetical protein